MSGHLWAPAGPPKATQFDRHLIAMTSALVNLSAPRGVKARVGQWLSQRMLLAAH